MALIGSRCLCTAEQKTVARYSMQQLLQEMVQLSPSWSEGQICRKGMGGSVMKLLSFSIILGSKAGVCSSVVMVAPCSGRSMKPNRKVTLPIWRGGCVPWHLGLLLLSSLGFYKLDVTRPVLWSLRLRARLLAAAVL